jgi:hypothetical protein
LNEKQTRLQIGHVLFIDIVGYSKLLVNQQSEILRERINVARTGFVGLITSASFFCI